MGTIGQTTQHAEVKFLRRRTEAKGHRTGITQHVHLIQWFYMSDIDKKFPEVINKFSPSRIGYLFNPLFFFSKNSFHFCLLIFNLNEIIKISKLGYV